MTRSDTHRFFPTGSSPKLLRGLDFQALLSFRFFLMVDLYQNSGGGSAASPRQREAATGKRKYWHAEVYSRSNYCSSELSNTNTVSSFPWNCLDTKLHAAGIRQNSPKLPYCDRFWAKVCASISNSTAHIINRKGFFTYPSRSIYMKGTLQCLLARFKRYIFAASRCLPWFLLPRRCLPLPRRCLPSIFIFTRKTQESWIE